MFSEPYQASYKNEIASFSQTDINKIVSSDRSLLVAVTRHPLSRFTSAWAQKFRRGGEFDKGRNQWLNQWPELENYLLNEQMQTTHRFEMLILKRPLPIKIIANVFLESHSMILSIFSQKNHHHRNSILIGDWLQVKWVASFRWSFGPGHPYRAPQFKQGCVFPMVIWPAFRMNSIESPAILTAHPSSQVYLRFFKAICAFPINMYFYRFVYGL